MSSAASHTTANLTIQQMSAAATRELCDAIGLGAIKPTDMKYLTLALAEVAAEEARRNPGFATRVCGRYHSLLPVKAPPKPKPIDRTRVTLVPIGTVDESLLDPYAPPNPWALQQLYGDRQLAQALNRYSLAKLKEAVALVQERFPGTKPQRLTKPGITDYIIGQLVATHD